ncbi:MAG: hypothetical protein LC670_14665, partial [Flavobacteriales bacterium]|nr:hypothetical protein [Flavobacteriales bacterium]
MNKKLPVFLWFAVGCIFSFAGTPSHKIKPENPGKKIWIDADLAVGMKRIGRLGYSDVDDGYAIIQ